MNLDRRTQLFVVLAGTFVTCLVVGDIIGGKLFEVSLFGWRVVPLSAGMIPFPVTFLLTDLLNEFYGKRAARFVTIIGLAMVILTLTLLEVAVQIPFAGFTRGADWTGVTEGAFANVFAGSKRILIASMIAYLIGQLVDIAVFNVLKRASQNRFLWLRATGSTAVSQLIDTVVIQVIAWYGVLSITQIGDIAIGSYAAKLVVAIGLTPLIYAGHAVLERALHLHPVQLDAQGNPIEAGQPSSSPS